MRLTGYLVLLSMMLMLALPHLAMAVVPVHNFDCQNCHLSGYAINQLGTGNVCLTCHDTVLPGSVPMIRTGNVAVASDGTFVEGDASNHYGNGLTVGDKTSHNWAATSANPAAGAAEPNRSLYPGFYSRYGTTVGKVACSRCHDPHGDYTVNKKLLPLKADRVTPLTPNEMCIACHKTFGDSAQSDHGFLSHPMVPTYNVTTLGSGYKTVSTNYDSNNPPADPYANGIQLVDGGVSCLSCHSQHFTDSDSTTTDGPTGNPGDNGPGDGLMLRGDGTQFYNSAVGVVNNDLVPKATSFCTTCHNINSTTAIHGSGGASDFGCMGCHGGHNYNNNDPSYYMLKDNYKQLPIEVTGTPGDPTRGDLWGGTQTGVADGFCETCHGDIADPGFSARSHTQGETCADCHISHNDGAFSKPIGCNTCHGYPPEVNIAGGPLGFADSSQDYDGIGGPDGNSNKYNTATNLGYSAGVAGFNYSEAGTPHLTHAGRAPISSIDSNYGYACNLCHDIHEDDFDGNHDQGTFQNVFDGTAREKRVDLNGTITAGYDNSVGSCTVYCHSDGGPKNSSNVRNVTPGAPSWNGTRGTIVSGGVTDCAACHGDSATLSSNKHAAHLAQGFSCDICHSDTVATGSTNTLLASAMGNNGTHVNTTVEVAFDSTAPIKVGGLAIGSRQDATAFDPASTTCAVYCHSSGTSIKPITYNTITWTGADTSLACDACHNIPSASQTAAHQAHVGGSASFVGRDLACDTCHSATVTGSSIISTPANHVNGKVDILMPASIDPATDCTTSKCHSDGNLDSVTDHVGIANPKNNTPAWTLADTTPGTFNACDKCHGDDANGKAYPAYNDGDAGGPDANSHNRHVGASGFSCEECHATTTTDGTSIIPGGTHVDQVINVGSTKVTAWDGSPTVKTCSAAACHGVDTPQWGGSVVCGSCHATNNTLAQSHPAHYDSATPGDYTVEANNSTAANYLIQCGICHSANGAGAISHGGGRATDAPTYNSAEINFDGTIASGTFARGLTVTNDPNAFEYSNATCANLYCHGNFGGNGNVATPEWGNAASGNCGTCHDADNSATMQGGKHNRHVKQLGLDCSVCHGATADNSTGGILDKSLHANQSLNWQFSSTYNAVSYFNSATYKGTNSGVVAKVDVGVPTQYGSCDLVYCHSNVQSSPPGDPLTYQQPLWRSATGLACGSCHKGNSAGAVNDTGSHTRHADSNANGGYAFDCYFCHNDAGSANPAKHANFSVDLAWDTTSFPEFTGANYGGSAEPGDPYGSCNTVYCHSDGVSASPVYNTVTWGDATDGACGSCHGTTATNPPTSAAHTKHVGSANSYQFACATCHDSVVTATANATVQPAIKDRSQHVADFIDLYSKDVVLSSGYNIATFNYADATGSCSSVYCHSSGQSADGLSTTPYNTATPSWSNAASGACGTCHKVSEASGLITGSHAEHLGTAGVNGCGDCHTGAANDAGSYPSANHVNKLIDVANSYSAAGAPGNGYGSCSAASCHDNGTGTPGVTPIWGTPGDCDTCHTSSNMTTGSHANHLGTLLRSTLSCSNCHDSADPSTGTAPTMHLNGNVNVYNSVNDFAGNQSITDLGYTYNTVKGGAPYDSCATSYCHGDSLKFSTEDMNDGLYNVAVVPTWGSNISDGTCDFCHGYPPVGDVGAGPQHPTSNDCSACHFHVNAADNGFGDLTKHIDGIVQIDGGNNCTDCHGTGKYKDPDILDPEHINHTDVQTFLAGKTLPGGDYAGSDWYSVTYDASGRLVVGCGQCHPDTQPTHPSGGAAEVDLDGTDAPVTAGAKKLNSSATFDGTNCNNVYCHSDGNVGGSIGFIASPNWDGIAGNGSVTCASCHGNAPATGAHGEHEVAIHIGDLYDNDGSGLMATDPVELATGFDSNGDPYGNGVTHGSATTSDPISCQVCHNDTVKAKVNVAGSACSSCHTSGDGKVGSSEISIGASTSAHLNGVKNVAILITSFKSKAQLRDNIADVNVGTYWNRIDTYKNSAGLGYDQVAIDTASFNTGLKTCSTTACHNGIETPAWDSGSSGNCMACHTELPK